MRTNRAENEILGKTLAEKVNRSAAPVKVLLPLGGISKISAKGGDFYAPEIDAFLFKAIRENLKASIPVYEVQENINTLDFAEQAVISLLELMGK